MNETKIIFLKGFMIVLLRGLRHLQIPAKNRCFYFANSLVAPTESIKMSV